jgi:hypothetical protein
MSWRVATIIAPLGVHGVKGGRNSLTVFNAAFHSVQLDGRRAATLEDQAKAARPATRVQHSTARLYRRVPAFL